MIFEHQALMDLDNFVDKIKKYLTFRAERVAAEHRRNGVTTGDVIEVVDNIRTDLGREFFDLDESKWVRANYNLNLTDHIRMVLSELDRPIQSNLTDDLPVKRSWAYQMDRPEVFFQRAWQLPRIFDNLERRLRSQSGSLGLSGL